MLKQLLPYLRPYRGQVAWALAQVFLITGFELLKPWPLQVVIDDVLGGKHFPLAALQGMPASRLLLLACLGIVVVQLGGGGLTLLHNYTTIRVGQNMVNDLRGALYAHLQRLSLAFHGRQRVGDLLYRVTADSFAVQTMIMNGALPILSAVVLLGRHAVHPVPARSEPDLARADRRPGAVRADLRVQPQDRRGRHRGAHHREPGLFAGAVGDVVDQGGAGLHPRGRRASPLHGGEPARACARPCASTAGRRSTPARSTR